VEAAVCYLRFIPALRTGNAPQAPLLVLSTGQKELVPSQIYYNLLPRKRLIWSLGSHLGASFASHTELSSSGPEEEPQGRFQVSSAEPCWARPLSVPAKDQSDSGLLHSCQICGKHQGKRCPLPDTTIACPQPDAALAKHIFSRALSRTSDYTVINGCKTKSYNRLQLFTEPEGSVFRNKGTSIIYFCFQF